MRVVKIINSLNFGGIERVFEIVAKYYRGEKGDLLFIALGSGGAAEKFIVSLGFRVIVMNARPRIPNVPLILKLYKVLRKERPHVVHTVGAEGNFHGLLAARLANVPVRVGEEIGIPSHSPVAKKLFRLVYRTSSIIIAVANSVGEYLVANREVVKSMVTIIYNPVDVTKYQNIASIIGNQFIVLTVCRLHPIKNLAMLVKVVARLSKTQHNIALWFVGEGQQREELQKLVSQLSIGELTIFWGYQSDPSTFLAQAGVFVLPSFSEGHPVSMIEAMVAGVPVVVTSVGGGPEIIREGENGWLVDPHNEDDIFRKIEQVIKLSSAQRATITAAAKDDVLKKFSPLQYLENLDSLYKRLSS